MSDPGAAAAGTESRRAPRITARITVGIALALILGLAALLRAGVTQQTEVPMPIRDDAAHYFWYAFNLKEFGIYSWRSPLESRQLPAPDALRPPGYPLLLAAVIDHPPTEAGVARVPWVQALLGVVVTALAFLFARAIVGPAWALLPALLTAASPHLVNFGIYLLTETLFSLTLVALMLVLTRRELEQRRGWLLAAGAVAGAAALVRPTADYLPAVLILLFFLRWPPRVALRASAWVLLGFALLFAPWAIRNAGLPAGAGDRLMINTLHHGMYPGFTYEGVPDSYGYPYKHDPRSREIAASLQSVTHEIARRFAADPWRHLHWYLLGKPLALWSWHEVQGTGDIYIYGVEHSPYESAPLFRATRAAMRTLHGGLVLAGALFCLAIWLPRVQRALPPAAVLPAQACALLLLYVTALHMIGLPLPRYAVPFRPELYVAATAALYLAVNAWRDARARRRPAA